MYDFILNMWVMGRIDEAKVNFYVPKYLTQDQANAIIATPQAG